MVINRVHGALLFASLLLSQLQLLAQEQSRHSLPDDPTKAWEEVQRLIQTLRPPGEWRAQQPTADQVRAFQEQIGRSAVSVADKTREFIARFPMDANVADARIWVVHALNHAVAAGDANAEQQIAEYVATVLSDKSIPEDNRVCVLLYSGNAVFMKKVGMRWFTEGKRKLEEEFETAGIESMHAALRQFPSNSLIYTMLVAVAQRSTGERRTTLATEILAAQDAPPGAKSLADHILKGTKPYELGKPIEVRFTAFDGRQVDLAKLTGKVVLVEFWSTDCGPCVGSVPMVKAVYEKLHDRGFEVVAISLDDKESVLRRFVKENDLPWPQQFDGKGWGNQFAVRYGIFSLPTMWLIDKFGNLRDTDARSDLEHRIESLLDEQSPMPN